MRQKAIKHIYLSLLFVLIPVSIAFWQTANEQISCQSCGSTPNQLLLINNFTKEIISVIKTIGTAAPYLGKHVPPSRFEKGRFSPPKQNILSKSLSWARQDLWSILALTRIYTNIGNIVNIGDSLLILWKGKIFLRDWNKTNQVGEQINNKKYELSVSDGRSDKIKGVPLQQMQTIIKKYTDMGILDPRSSLWPEAEYNEIISILWAINNAAKHLIAAGWTARVSKPFTKGDSSILITSKAIENIQQSYACAKWGVCESSRKNIKQEIKNIENALKNWTNNALWEIKSANKKLTSAYSKQNLKNLRSEQALIKKFKKDIEKFRNRRDTQDIQNQEQTRKKNSDSIPPTSQAISISSEIQKSEKFKAYIDGSIASIQQEGEDMIQNAQIANVQDITPQFADLSFKLTNLTKNILWSKDQDSTLIKNLWVLCEKQCTNISNKKCYY